MPHIHLIILILGHLSAIPFSFFTSSFTAM